MGNRQYIIALALALAVAALSTEPAMAGTSRTGSVSQTITIRVVIPELPPLAVKSQAATLGAGTSDLEQTMARSEQPGGRQVSLILDQHGRLYTRQIETRSDRVNRLLSAP